MEPRRTYSVPALLLCLGKPPLPPERRLSRPKFHFSLDNRGVFHPAEVYSFKIMSLYAALSFPQAEGEMAWGRGGGDLY